MSNRRIDHVRGIIVEETYFRDATGAVTLLGTSGRIELQQHFVDSSHLDRAIVL